MKKTGVLFFGIVLFVIILTAAGIYVKVVSNWEPVVRVVYAEKSIPAKTVITADMLSEKEIYLSYAHRLAARSIIDVAGKRATADIEQGEMVLTNRYTNADKLLGIELQNKDCRLFTVQFNPDQVNGWWLMVGQYVDILFVPNPQYSAGVQDQNRQDRNMAASQYSRQGEPTQQASQSSPSDNSVQPETLQSGSVSGIIAVGYDKSQITRLSKVRVAALITETGELLDNSKRDVLPKYISFEVTTEQDNFLAWAKSNGRIEVSSIGEQERK